MNFKKIFISIFILATVSFIIYYFYPIQKIPAGITIDNIVVFKEKHQLLAYSNGQLIVTYIIAIGKKPVGDKQYEGDQKTPEGFYTISGKNPLSGYHKNLGISYPNAQDIEEAQRLSKPVGGDIKIHGLKNGQGYIGKFQRWKDWTNGCIALTDEELDELYDHTPLGTSIEIRK
ncbi:MAG: L,D-transpeptidase family protein [Agriterribacter sp.]